MHVKRGRKEEPLSPRMSVPVMPASKSQPGMVLNALLDKIPALTYFHYLFSDLQSAMFWACAG